jgi:hypothetical protein
MHISQADPGEPNTSHSQILGISSREKRPHTHLFRPQRSTPPLYSPIPVSAAMESGHGRTRSILSRFGTLRYVVSVSHFLQYLGLQGLSVGIG